MRELADGRVYTDAEAARLGLVDGVGYLDDALAETVRVKLDVPGMPAHGAAFLYVWDAGTAR